MRKKWKAPDVEKLPDLSLPSDNYSWRVVTHPSCLWINIQIDVMYCFTHDLTLFQWWSTLLFFNKKFASSPMSPGSILIVNSSIVLVSTLTQLSSFKQYWTDGHLWLVDCYLQSFYLQIPICIFFFHQLNSLIKRGQLCCFHNYSCQWFVLL